VTLLVVIPVIVYVVFGEAPVKVDGPVVEEVVDGPGGDTRNMVDNVAGPTPLVQLILKLLLVAVGAVPRVSVGGVGPVI
jgi:hypothetical protein